MRKNTSKLDKLSSKAWISYLAGYKGRNNYNIWNPATNKIHTVRDVTFDESQIFKNIIADIPQLQAAEQDINAALRAYSIPPHSPLTPPTLNTHQQLPTHPPPAPEAPTAPSQSTQQAVTKHAAQLPTPETTPDPENIVIRSNQSGGQLGSISCVLCDPPSSQNYHCISCSKSCDQPASVLDHSRITAPWSKFLAHDDLPFTTSINLISTSLESYLDHDIYPDYPPGGVAEALDDSITAKAVASLHILDSATVAVAATTGAIRRHGSTLSPPPKTMKQLEKHPDAASYRAAAQVELDQITESDTWTLVDRQALHDPSTVLLVKWVFTHKLDNDGYLVKFKARLVVRGDLQHNITSRRDVYAQTAAIQHFRVLIAYAAKHNHAMHQLDAVTAFL